MAAVGLVHPPLDAAPSGGNVYDAKLLEQSRRSAMPWASLCWPMTERDARRCEVLLWDSLLLGRVRRLGRERLALLLHYLPSLQCDGAQASDARAVEDRAAAEAAFFIATGRPLADIVRQRWPLQPVFVCEPGVDPVFRRRRSAKCAQAVALLTVASLSAAKGHEALLGVLERLCALPWRWHVVGADDPGSRVGTVLRERARHAGLGERVVFHGPLPQARVAAVMARCDLLLHPSRAESYGMVLAEAAACGLPALSFRVGAAEQLIRHGENGLLAPAGDWDGFAQHLERFLTDPALRGALARGHRRGIRSWEQTFAEVEAAVAAVPT
jgi:glycosyltransferase involved in cell wall biosynthesis